MSAPGSFGRLLVKLRGGSPEAAEVVFRRYAERLIALAGHHLNERFRRHVDPEDVLQSVFRSFFHRSANGAFELDSEQSLWRLLVRLTLNKCGCRARFEQAACRDVRRERGLTADADRILSGGDVPSPVEAATLADMTAYILSRLATPAKRRILELSLAGHSVVEISDALGYYERGVERVRAEIRRLLQELLSEGDVAAAA